MFYIDRNNDVRLSEGHWRVCHIDDIPRAINELNHLASSKEEEGDNKGIFTSEGIDRYFTADPDFVASQSQWEEDSENDWENVSDSQLFVRYPKHAETYCWGCRDSDTDPTYKGFRRWLMLLRDTCN